MSEEAPVLWSVDERGVGTITINRPDKRNALNSDVLAALVTAFRSVDREPAVRAVVLTGAGDKAFSAGGDLEKFLDEQGRDPGRQGGRFAELFASMGQLGVPVIGRINGHCLAGALGIALACDLLVAVADAEFGTPEILVGLWPMMISALIYRNVPRKIANELMWTGRRLSAAEAERIGIVNRVVPRERLDATIDDLSNVLVRHPRAVAAMGRRALFAQQDMPFLDALRFLEAQLRDVLATADAREGLRAFLERRPPRFTGE